MRKIKKIPFSDLNSLRPKILDWATGFEETIWMDGNDYPLKEKTYRALLAVDAFTAIRTDFHNGFDKLEEYQKVTQDWIFGYLSYDLKNDIANLSSKNIDGLGFPDLYFFQPKKILLFFDDFVELHYLNFVADEMDSDWDLILKHSSTPEKLPSSKCSIQSRTSKSSYFEKVSEVLENIKEGNIQELNLCQEFYAEDFTIDPLDIYLRLNDISKPPFSVFLKLNEFFAFSASPERYIKRSENRVISQPIKGTSRRSKDPVEDKNLASSLQSDEKERGENIMIANLVQNDLSLFAEKGSVMVEELCGLYSFKQVHQLISTISCQVSATISNVEILRKTFPMGSMAGTPRDAALKLIERIEDFKRGLYSGAIGYMDPFGNFDFNVVIRSILYNANKNYISYSVGSAITINSVPEREYEECLVKAKAMSDVLTSECKLE